MMKQNTAKKNRFRKMQLEQNTHEFHWGKLGQKFS